MKSEVFKWTITALKFRHFFFSFVFAQFLPYESNTGDLLQKNLFIVTSSHSCVYSCMLVIRAFHVCGIVICDSTKANEC